MPARHPADQPDAVDDGLQIVAAGIGPFFEIVEVDRRPRARIGRGDRHRAAAIVGVAFEHDPRQIVVVLGGWRSEYPGR